MLFFSELSCDFSPQWKTSLLLSQEPERTSYNIPVNSLWTPIQHINASV
uniref:Uncharacterized protein n=1 Tax=Anguilla anguilla TaxID=7936 RepID=A0A0E9QI42_ANGAN